MRNARGALLAVAACVALLTATGCGGQAGDDGPERSDRQPTAASAQPGRGSGAGEGKSEAKAAGNSGKSKPEASDAPKVPDAELTPATGSFTKKQKRYLEGRVPKGIDPAAVAAGGQEICERITRTEEVDRKAVIDAVKSKEIAGAKAAITHLCPEHRDLLVAAGM